MSITRMRADVLAQGLDHCEAELAETKARLAEAERDAEKYHVAMTAWKRTKMEHGLCQPRSRKACSHCNAVDELDAMLAAYKGRRITARAALAGEKP